MTTTTIHHIDSTTLAVAFDFDATKKEVVAAMTGAQWQKAEKRWTLPVARLGDVVKLFWPDVSIDYDVLRARDEQLRRLFRQYRACGVTFAIVAGKVTCDHDVLNGWFAAHGNALHVQALQDVLLEVSAAARPKKPATGDYDDRMISLLLRGVQNAVKAEEKKAAMLAGMKRRKVRK